MLSLSNVKIAYKGVALVLLPLLLSFVFLGLLSWVLRESELDRMKEAQARHIQEQTNALGTTFMQTVSTVGSYVLTGSEGLKTTYDHYMNRNEEIRNDLRKLTAGSKSQSRKLEKMEKLQRRAFEIMDALMQLSLREDRSAFLRVIGMRAELESTIKQFMSDVAAFAEEGRRKRTASPTTNWKALVQQVVTGGFVLSGLVSILLAVLFSKSITERLNLLIRNTERLSAKQPLLPRLPGKDEVAVLDTVFHDLADSLEAAAKREQVIQEMKKEFLAMLTHDLRAPLGAVRLCLNLLQEGEHGQIDSSGQKLISRTEVEVDRLIQLVNDMLDTEKLESGQMKLDREVIDLENLVARAIDSLSTVADNAGIKIETELSPCETVADGPRLIRVIVNLLTNAIKFSPPGGTIAIKCREKGNKVEVQICDQGRGIPLELQATIFEKFSQIAHSDGVERTGTGLGLTICRAIIEAHGGEIGVTSEPERGSTFWFRIPIPD